MTNKDQSPTIALEKYIEKPQGGGAFVIPTYQRGYVWGKKRQGDADSVTHLIDTLIAGYRSRQKEVFLQGITVTETGGDVVLIDGQQRTTTLFLLLGVLNRHRPSDGRLQSLLVLEKGGDQESRLEYAVRESSLYFLGDLVREVFLKGAGAINIDKEIRKADWYLRDYDHDPTAQAMLGALERIEEMLKGRNAECLDQLRNFLLKRLTLLYYDMGSRENGEETYVIINTTGEPLSPAQNLKPLIVGKATDKGQASRDWEEIETWFWQKRGQGNDTADAGMEDFLRWVAIIKRSLDEGEEVDLADLKDYWEALKRICREEVLLSNKLFQQTWLSPAQPLDNADILRLVPLLHYAYWHSEATELDLRREGEYFSNLARLASVDNKEAIRPAILSADKMGKMKGDILSLLEVEEPKALPAKEREKLEILKGHPDKRETLEEAFWELQRTKLWDGDINLVIGWSKKEGQFDFDEFRKVREVASLCFPPDQEKYGGECDCVRRLMIAMEFEDYPLPEGVYYKFGHNVQEIRKILGRNKGKFKDLIEGFRTYLKGSKPTTEALEEYCREKAKELVSEKSFASKGETRWRSEFVHYETLLGYMDKKLLHRGGGGALRQDAGKEISKRAHLRAEYDIEARAGEGSFLVGAGMGSRHWTG